MNKILIIDDNNTARKQMVEMLTNAGFEIDDSNNVRVAAKKAILEAFDVILIDQALHNNCDVDIVEELRMVRPLTRIVYMSAFAGRRGRTTSRNKKCILSKPFELGEFIDMIGQLQEEVRFGRNEEETHYSHILFALSSPIRRNIIKLLHTERRLRLVDITKGVGITDHTKVIFHLKMLKESGIISQYRKKLFYLTDEGEKAVDVLRIMNNYFAKYKK